MSFSVNTPGRAASAIPPLNLRAGVGLHWLWPLYRKLTGRRHLTHGSGWSSLLLFSFFLFPSLCRAEIFIEPRIGFHGVFQLGRPFPLEIELSNSGRPAEGTLEIAVWKGGATKGGAPYPLYYRRDVFLSPQSRKTVQLTVDPDFISRPLRIMFLSPTGTASREIDLRRHFSPSPVILLVSEGNAIPAVSLGSALTNRLVALTLAELPPDPRALLGVSHLILYDQSLRDLSRSQLLALDTWLTAGGRMVILGSLNYSLYQEPAISRFLPVRVTGTKRVSFDPALGQSGRASPIADVWAQASTVIGGKVLAEVQGMPVLVETSRGKGRITYLSLDVGRPPLSQWDGLPRFLQNLLAPAGGDELAPRTRWDDAVFSQLILSPSFLSTYLPTGSLFVAIVGYLIGIGLFSWLWQRQGVTRRALIAAFLFFVVFSTCGGYLLFSRGGNIPDGVLLSSSVMESSADGYVEVQSNLAMFSTQIRQYGLQMERGWMELVPVAAPSRDRPEPAVVFQDGSGSSRFQLPLREWDYRLFRIRFVDRFPLRAEFEQQAGKLRMRVNNQSAKDLVDCWLVMPGQRYPLGDIPRGASWTKEFPLASEEGQEPSSGRRSDTVDFREISFKDKTREILFHSSFFPRDEGSVRWSTGAAVFFGWVKDPDRRVSVDDQRIRNYDYTLFRTIFPLAGPEDE
jgi:hypothetical protein